MSRPASDAYVLLDPLQMAAADRAAMAAGVPGVRLMEAAGTAVAQAICARWSPRPVRVLCGPGNNGGDGFVAARLLQQAGWPVRLALWGDHAALRGDAAWAAGTWAGPVEAAGPAFLQGAELVVDALLGAGLDRAPTGSLAVLLEAVRACAAPVCAVDVPTGLHGGSGQCPGVAVQAELTVTFFRRKPGHLLLPGRALCGAVVCADIGIPAGVLGALPVATWANHPDLWRAGFPWPSLGGHKYRRGHVLVIGSAHMPGASRLACLAAARIGAGLVTLAVPAPAWAVQAGALTSVMVEPLPADGSLQAALADGRRNALVIGPGLGRHARARRQVLDVLATGRPCVLDADALSAFEAQPGPLLAALHGHCVLTPHEGEFARLFGHAGDKLLRARAAARDCGAVVLLKGADTVIAAPDGAAVINDNAPPTLATGGTGDVLAGCVAGLLAAGMPAFQAACAAVWLHGLAADQLGWGLLAEDLPQALPKALQILSTC
ncbi:NAD(P)H-hydrate dehydratase [Castellaniella sp.]|uniref:NAD(P)H-hydrate dehydratase n=1 Tax=Castellaniella sp. TaxID=1955812 RepID=UPI0035694F2C